MRILLVSTNRSREIMPCMPVGVACIKSVVGDHEVEFLDLFLEEKPEDALRKTVHETQPGLIGFSIRNVDNQLWSRTQYYLPEVKRYIEIVREESRMPIVVGGAAYSVFPHVALQYLGADWGIVGDAEVSFPSFVSAIENCLDPSSIPGVINPDDSGSRFIPPRVEDYSAVPMPSFDVLHCDDYIAQNGSLSIISRRGCPYKCVYCDVPASEGHQISGKTPKRLVDEIESAARLGVKNIFIADNVFNSPPSYACAVAEEIIRRNIKIVWSATLHPHGLDADTVTLLRKSGLVMASIGPDSGSPKMLETLNKGCTVEEAARAVKLLKENEIGMLMTILLGGPGEDRSTVEESVDFATNAGATITGVRVGIRVTPLTGLHKIALDEGVLSPDDNLMEPRFYVSDDIRDWIFDYLNSNLKGMPGVIIQ